MTDAAWVLLGIAVTALFLLTVVLYDYGRRIDQLRDALIDNARLTAMSLDPARYLEIIDPPKEQTPHGTH